MEKQWWQTQTAYQIWPKSFMDSNGDGIGDLRGIISKLDYLKDLGIGILWLSPIYRSPLADEGYDISDYYDIDPRFGTMADFDELLAEAKKRGIHVLMDLVVNHCSDEHAWFQKACEDPDGPYGQYFYIEDWDGEHLPCNWRSYFGGPVWEVLPGHPDKVYLHLFHKKQPDLNWENPALRDEICTMVNWWLDKGVDGFRLDAIINIKKVLPFRDYPADREDGLANFFQMFREQEGIGAFLGELRDRCFAPHHAFTVGELFNAKPEELPLYIGENGYFSSIFDFSAELCGKDPAGWYKSKPYLYADEYRSCLIRGQQTLAAIGMPSNIIENHDEPRGVSHLLAQNLKNAHSDTAKKALAGVFFCLRGIPFLYQGQEIGMENVPLHSIDEVDDCSTLDQYQTALDAGLSPEEALSAVNPFSRDNARTPMQWTSGKNAGFTEGTPWLPVNPSYLAANVESEEGDPDSVLSFYRQLTRLRSADAYRDVLCYGDFLPYRETQKDLIAYYRTRVCEETGRRQTLLVLAAFAPETMNIPLPEAGCQSVLSNGVHYAIYGNTLTLVGWGFLILELTEA